MAFDISKFASTMNVSDSDTPEVREIDIRRIATNERNFYPPLPEAEAEALRDSIEANGLLEPLTVVPTDEPGYYRLISGHNRFMALQHLWVDAEDTRWDMVLCLVLPAMSEQQELSAIIEANRQRKKNGALLAEEAEKLTAAYVARKQAGEDLPGRIRDRVAEALQVSKTKLATVTAIKNHLGVPGFKAKWEKGEITEEAAYEISKLTLEQQYRYLDWTIDKHQPATAKTVAAFLAESKRPAPAPKPAPAPRIVPPEPAEVPEWQQKRDAFGARLRELREATGLSRAEFAEKIDECKGTYSAWENGNLPGCDRMPKLAKALGVSTDYLFGLTDQRDAAPSAQVHENGGLHWQPLDAEHWPEIGDFLILRGWSILDGRVYQSAHCQGGIEARFPFEDAYDHYDIAYSDLTDMVEWMLLEGRG